MQPLHNFQLLPWNLMSEAASLRAQEKNQKQVESPPRSPLNQPQSKTVKAAGPQMDFPTGRRRNKNSSSVVNEKKPEAVTPPSRRLRLKHQEEKTDKRKGKETVVVDEDYVADFKNLRSRTTAEQKQQIGQCSSIFIDPKASSANGFSLSLSKKEIEADFLLMTGKKPPRNPKRRKTSVQKRINNLHLGMELASVCEKVYEVKEKIPRKRRGSR